MPIERGKFLKFGDVPIALARRIVVFAHCTTDPAHLLLSVNLNPFSEIVNPTSSSGDQCHGIRMGHFALSFIYFEMEGPSWRSSICVDATRHVSHAECLPLQCVVGSRFINWQRNFRYRYWPRKITKYEDSGDKK
jgi:hypothetical protein